MQTIDFLPEHYRERRKQRRVRWWWALIVCLFGGIVVATASLQWLSVQRVKRELAQLELQCKTHRQLDQELLALETKVASLSHSANLYTFLKHPWPRTQILAAVVSPLPEEVQLTSIRIAETLVAKKPAVGATPEASVEANKPTPPAAVADLQQLHDAHEAQRIVVHVAGSVKEAETLHAYLESLARQPLIAEARLSGMETRKLETHSLVVFELHITIKSAHGLSDGPAGPIAPELTAGNPQPETASRDEENLR
ncbi:PilN domain-containing protein [Anatilimnocola floriformis]|uniref:PilN domain-containing protein n=1 Tax=Anatilimnocola floriformis TaxID=2948575 RepID=UPI0020C1C55B|nr:PilN domain-containing protein [Anatilimnocola floriformis]